MKVKKLIGFSILFFFLLFLHLKLVIAAYKLADKNLKLKALVNEFESLGRDKVYYNSNAPIKADAVKVDMTFYDGRVANLQAFIRKYNPHSPLYELADKIVEVSDKYGLDYRLLVAIAMQESNLCKRIPKDSYNCWGWGIYGDKVTKFKSYEEAIETVAKGLKEKYVDKGHYTIYTIMRKYNPSSDGSWGDAVKKFFLMLE